MDKSFFDNKFDDATILKLKIFRQYLREWLPVFMTQKMDGQRPKKHVHIYDFFAGPGKDSAGNPGSPLIIVDEIKQYCANKAELRANASVRMVFNDVEKQYIAVLQNSVKAVACDQSCCEFEYKALPFKEALSHYLADINSPRSASLVIMDQFGIKEVSPEVVQDLARCSTTDILFFISTSFIRRFIETPEIGAKYDLKSDELKNLEYNVIHRYICDYYRQKLNGSDYYLAPFSIKKGSNIYGVIFGSNSLLGLEKFLKVCWSLDSVTGEANYNIDKDFSWNGQLGLFKEYNKINKIDLFETELRDYIDFKKPDNIVLNKFCLIKGFPPAKAKEVLNTLQEKGYLLVWDIKNGKAARKGSFYLGWINCKSNIAKVRFDIKAGS